MTEGPPASSTTLSIAANWTSSGWTRIARRDVRNALQIEPGLKDLVRNPDGELYVQKCPGVRAQIDYTQYS
jgi:hypothetical protein